MSSFARHNPVPCSETGAILQIVVVFEIGLRYGPISSNRFSSTRLLCPTFYWFLPQGDRLNLRSMHIMPRCHVPQSEISDELIAAYQSANYRVEDRCETFILR